MAGFHTHIGVSTVVGMGYAVWGGAQYQLPLSTCVLAGGLCSIAGMMPDLDSDSGVPARETIGLAAAVVPMLLFQRFQAAGMDIEHMVLAGAPLYLVIRFGLGSILKAVSVHRGMFHSIPAAIIAGLIGYLICDSGVNLVRYYKAFAVTLGYMTHLMLDEVWSLDFGAGVPRVKKSFGTALKLFGDEPGATLTTYCLLGLLMMFAANDQSPPVRIQTLPQRQPARAPSTPRRVPYEASPPNPRTAEPRLPERVTIDDPFHQPLPADDGWERPRAVRRTRLDDDWR